MSVFIVTSQFPAPDVNKQTTTYVLTNIAVRERLHFDLLRELTHLCHSLLAARFPYLVIASIEQLN